MIEYQDEIKKVKRRVPRWFKNNHQINSRILIAFLDLQKKQKFITPETLEKKCANVEKFKNNYNQMKNFGEKNHGKVFDENNNEVKLWEPVKEFILKEYKNTNNIIAENKNF